MEFRESEFSYPAFCFARISLSEPTANSGSCMITIFPRKTKAFARVTAAILTSSCLARLLRNPRRNDQVKFTMPCVEMRQHFTPSSTTQIGRLKVHQAKNALMNLFFFCCAWGTSDFLSFLLVKIRRLATKWDMRLIRKLTGTSITSRKRVRCIAIDMCDRHVDGRNVHDKGVREKGIGNRGQSSLLTQVGER
jgi:hypothetical protein